MTAKPRVAVISTGGTISGIGSNVLDVFNYGFSGRFMKGDELIERVPELREFADIVSIPYSNVSSAEMGPKNWLDLAALLTKLRTDDIAISGAVITHGTASLEETAYFLNLVLKVEFPVVLVGSQRPPTALGSDAALNLLNAVRVASAPSARGMGALVVLNGEINAAREVTKTSTYRSQAFQSQDLGLLGYMDGDQVSFYRSPLRAHFPNTEFDVTGISELPRVDIVPSYAGADEVLIEAALAAGCRGLIAASMAPGVTTKLQALAYERAIAKGIPVVMSTRVAAGRITGAREAIVRSGMIPADTLSPQKARILLMLSLLHSSDYSSIAAAFQKY